jgi:hypothetical protein
VFVAVIHTGPDEHAYQLDLEFYGEVDDDIKQVPTLPARCCFGLAPVILNHSSINPSLSTARN